MKNKSVESLLTIQFNLTAKNNLKVVCEASVNDVYEFHCDWWEDDTQCKTILFLPHIKVEKKGF